MEMGQEETQYREERERIERSEGEDREKSSDTGTTEEKQVYNETKGEREGGRGEEGEEEM